LAGARFPGEMKYVLVTGGVVSGLGKGVTASSIGVVLKSCGLRITSIKIGTPAAAAAPLPPPCNKSLRTRNRLRGGERARSGGRFLSGIWQWWLVTLDPFRRKICFFERFLGRGWGLVWPGPRVLGRVWWKVLLNLPLSAISVLFVGGRGFRRVDVV
jgi:hypothetical protein